MGAFGEEGGGELQSITCRFNNGTDKFRGGSEEIISDDIASSNGWHSSKAASIMRGSWTCRSSSELEVNNDMHSMN